MNQSLKLKCEHIGLGATAPRELAEWYEKIFRFKKSLRGNNEKTGPYFLLDKNSGFIIEIFHSRNIVLSGSVHFCFLVDNIQNAIASLKDNVEVVSELRKQEDGSQVYFFRDPQGYVLQFIER